MGKAAEGFFECAPPGPGALDRRESLPDARLRAALPFVPVLADERADSGLNVLAALEVDGVNDVPNRPQEEHILWLVGPRAFGARHHRPPTGPALRSLGRLHAAHLNEGVSDGIDEVSVLDQVSLS